MRGLWSICLLFVWPAIVMADSELEKLTQDAVVAYASALDESDRELRTQGFRQAELRFAKLTQQGVRNADLYTNLGNAALQGERLGHAILAYRRALRLDPDHSQARQNLTHARALLPAWVPRPDEGGLLDTFFFWHRTLSRGERTWAGAILFVCGAGLLAGGLRWRQTLLRNLAIVAGLVWAGLWISLLIDVSTDEGTQAVVTAAEAVARSADSMLAPSPFAAPLPAGTELSIVEQRAPFVRVRLANGSDAWLNEASLTRLEEPS